MLTYEDMSHIRGRIAQVGVRQADVADIIGIHETLFNAILRGRREAPKGFCEQVHATLDRLEKAEKAAQEARERVLTEGG